MLYNIQRINVGNDVYRRAEKREKAAPLFRKLTVLSCGASRGLYYSEASG